MQYYFSNKPLNTTDIETLHAQYNVLVSHTHPYGTNVTLESFAQLFANPVVMAVFVEDDHREIVATVQLTRLCTLPQDQAFLSTLLVLPSARGNDYEKMALRSLLKNAYTTWGDIPVSMVVTEKTEEDMKLYTELGFQARTAANNDAAVVLIKQK